MSYIPYLIIVRSCWARIISTCREVTAGRSDADAIASHHPQTRRWLENRYVSDGSTCITYIQGESWWLIFIQLRARQLCITTREQSRRMKASMNESEGWLRDMYWPECCDTDSNIFRSKELGSSILREGGSPHRCLELLKKSIPKKVLFDLPGIPSVHTKLRG